MKPLSTLLWRPATVATLLAALAVPTLFSASWAGPNYCPGSPWDCQFFHACAAWEWCGTGGTDCSADKKYYDFITSFIIKRCTNQYNSEVRNCSSCESVDWTTQCCPTLINEPDCPDVHGCP